MQKIYEQQLAGTDEYANKEAVYTWKKNEIAWRYCFSVHSISKVKFTGERWLIGNHWGHTKIYQFEILTSTQEHLPNAKLSHDSEESFFETLEETKDHAIRHINRLIIDNTKRLNDEKESILTYCKTEMTFKRETLTEKTFSENGNDKKS